MLYDLNFAPPSLLAHYLRFLYDSRSLKKIKRLPQLFIKFRKLVVTYWFIK